MFQIPAAAQIGLTTDIVTETVKWANKKCKNFNIYNIVLF